MTTFEMLQELLAQNEFELLLSEDHTANTTEQDIRLVYQMNDTVESFLVFSGSNLHRYIQKGL